MTNEESLKASYVNGLGYAQVSLFQHCWKTMKDIISNFPFAIFLIKMATLYNIPIIFLPWVH